jgi:hypothetical protein
VANTKWLDRSQPQTLYSGTVLLYFNAFWWLLDLMTLNGTYLGVLGSAVLSPVMALGALFAGLAIANERREGYWGGVAIAVVNLLALVVLFVDVHGQSFSVIINLVFGVALLALLLHPMSRNYQRIWFRTNAKVAKALRSARVRQGRNRRGWPQGH